MARKVFPSSPNVNDIFTSTKGKKFQWNGKVWKRTQDTNVESMTLDSSADEKLALHGSDNPTIRFREGSNDKGNLHWKASTGEMRLVNEESSQELRLGSSGVTVTGDLDVTGNLEVTGTTTFNGGTLTLGDSATDNVVFGADVNSSITPNTDDAYDLGSSNKQWRNLYVDGTGYIDNVSSNTISCTTFTGTNATFGGNVDLGNNNSDTITANGRFDSDLIPSTDDARDLGSNSRQWKDLYIDGIANIDTLRADSGSLTTASISGGSIDSTTIGGSTPAAGTFTNLTVNGELADGDGNFGTSGQVLSSDGTDTAWVNAGSLTAGAAALVGVTAVSDDASHFMAFVDSSSGNENIKVDTGLTYNPSSNILTASSFSGALNGIVGGTTPAAGTFTTLVANGNVNLGNGGSDTITANGRFGSSLLPTADGTYNLGSSILEWNDLYIDGTANIDSLVADTADINAGTIDGATIGANSASTGAFTSVTVSTTLDVSGAAIFDGNVALGNATSDTITATGRFNSSLVPSTDDARDLGTSSLQWRDLYIDGTANIDSLVADTADINGGTIDGTAIGGNSPSSGAFTSISASGNVDLGNSTSDTITATGRFDSNLVPNADSSRVLGSSALRWSKLWVDAITATNDVSIAGNLEVIGDANITGTLTYEDVTNIDSVGVVTARSGLVVSSGGATISGGITGDLTGDVTGNADTATTLATSRTLSISSDATGSASFNGGANADIAITLANSGVTAGTYGSSSAIPAITVDAKGRITSATTSAIDSTSVSNGGESVSVSSGGQITSSANHDFDAGIDVTGNITVSGTVDGRDVATDGSKLDGIESGATADQTAAEIRTLVESASDSNVFTDDDHSKLNGIAAGAEVNVATNLAVSTAGTEVEITCSTGNNATIGQATSSAAGVMTTAHHDKLDGIASGAQVNVATDLGRSTSTTQVTITSSTGSNTTIDEASGSAAGVMSVAHHNKLDGIASGATNVSNTNQLTNGAGFITSSSNISGTAAGLSGTPNITVGTISCGNITSSGTVTANSDAKLKKNVATVSNALDKVNLLRGVEFDYIANDKHSIGVIAQEVEAVLPDLVEGDETKSVAYGNLTAVLIEAVKELTAEVNTLKAELNTLKGE